VHHVNKLLVQAVAQADGAVALEVGVDSSPENVHSGSRLGIEVNSTQLRSSTRLNLGVEIVVIIVFVAAIRVLHNGSIGILRGDATIVSLHGRNQLHGGLDGELCFDNVHFATSLEEFSVN